MDFKIATGQKKDFEKEMNRLLNLGYVREGNMTSEVHNEITLPHGFNYDFTYYSQGMIKA